MKIIEEKARAYDKAVINGSRLWESGVITRENYEYIFPELKESEDERIRKALIKFHKSTIDIDGIKGDDIVAWLERQGEQKPMDKVEPKFKVGDWVVRGKTIAQILDIQEQYYVGLDIDGNDFTSSRFLSDDKIYLWTIQDAKDGDVLVCGENKLPFIFRKFDRFHPNCPVAYCGIGDDGTFIVSVGDSSLWTDSDVCPATKEQRDLLFQKMKEAGYEWDAEKKELKKIEQKFKVGDTVKDPYGDLYHITEIIDDSYKTDDGRFILFKNQEVYTLFNFTDWSEEDDRMYNRIVSFIPQHLTAESYTACINWFKGLKDRVQPHPQWMPSDEQMNAFDAILVYNPPCSDECRNHLITLYNELKKLKE